MSGEAKRDDGGPAFPSPIGPDGQMPHSYGLEGMTLRDWFAGQAIGGWLASFAHPDIDIAMGCDENAVASFAYRCADAMLDARASRAAQCGIADPSAFRRDVEALVELLRDSESGALDAVRRHLRGAS